MNRKIATSVLLILALTIAKVQGQSAILTPEYLTIEIDPKTKDDLLISINALFDGIDNNKLDSTLINADNHKLAIEVLNSLRGNENNEKDSIKNFYKRQLINLYPISNTDYFISIAYIGTTAAGVPVLKTIFNITAKNEHGKFVFSIPTSYLTKTWKVQKVGHITYSFADGLNVGNAKVFDKKNTVIATKFGLIPKKLNFYLCDNYQQVLQLLGYGYDMESNGKTRSGYGVEANTIFSVMHNEDFSHDLFHYYSAKVRTNKRNWYAEEGFAYCWGNAYWNKPNGETITQDELVAELQKYLKLNPGTSLLGLFDKQPRVFEYLSDEITLKKILSSVICKEVEKKKGIEGVKELLNCGPGEDNFFNATNKLIQINRTNFDIEVGKLVESYH